MSDELPEISVEAPTPPLPPPRPTDIDPPATTTTGQSDPSGAAAPTADAINGQQYIRECSVTINGTEVNNLRCRFAIRHSETGTPANADVWVFNLSKATANSIPKEGALVQVKAGYQGASALIFEGEAIQKRYGRASPVETYLNVVATHHDKAYNRAIVSKTLASGHTFKDQVQEAFDAMQKQSSSLQMGYISDLLSQTKMPRARTLFGMARDVFYEVARATRTSWSIQNNKLQFVENDKYAQGQSVVINSATGMVGLPVQTFSGIEVTTLLNPRIIPGTRIQLNQSSIQEQQFSPEYTAEKQRGLLPGFAADGTYKVVVVDHEGDTHGQEWYSRLICIDASGGSIPPALTARGIPIPA